MWRCPRCVTHVRDGQSSCPVCRTDRPEPLVQRTAEDPLDLDPLLSRPPVESLVPALARPDLAKKEVRSLGRAFWAAFVSILVLTVLGFCGQAESVLHFLGLLILGLLFGAVAGS